MKLSLKPDPENNRPAFLATHDSATGMVMALSNCLRGKAFEGVGAVPTNEFYAKMINGIPGSWRRKLYSEAGEFSALSYKKANEIDASKIDRWVFDSYPERKYPAIAVGSCNGAMIHFFAAMGIPWLPQTTLIPIDKEQDFPVDEPKKTLEWAKEPAARFLQNNPGWQLHHMMDPNQDRLRVDSVGYFRVKKLELGTWYKKFIEERLQAGGRIIVVDCNFQWPVHKVGDRHYFQFGGTGGLQPEEYYKGSEAVTEFLKQANASVNSWDAPEPDEKQPEAEWGLVSSLAEDIRSFTNEKKLPLCTIHFDHPQDTAAPIAELFRKWYRQQGIMPDRLLVESFNLLSPYLSLKKGCVPYWLFFNVDKAAEDLENYLDHAEPFEEIYMMMLSHGKHSWGNTTISRWEAILRCARQKSDFIGTTPEEYPLDMAVYARYSKDLKKKVPEDQKISAPLEVEEGLRMLREIGGGKVEVLG